MDKISKEKRSKNMASVRSKNTTPELLFRKELYKNNIRYRIHPKQFPGKPDILIKKYKLVIEIRGCFWHGHEGCRKGHIPKSNIEYWSAKIYKNKKRDLVNEKKIKALDFKYITVWECEIYEKNKFNKKIKEVVKQINIYKEKNRC